MNDLSPSLVEEILGSVDNLFEQQIEFTQRLVRHPSQRGDECSAQQYIYTELESRGYDVDQWSIDVDEIKDHPGFSPVTLSYENSINVVGTHRSRLSLGRSLILNGHIDVVPTGPESMWSMPPYDPVIRDGWLYGRGSGDMKAGLVANIYAMDALAVIGYKPAAEVYLQSVTEEECTGNGALSCLVRGYKADAAIIPEPVEEKLVRANVGVIWFKLHVQGKPVHVRESGSGANAIDAMYSLIQALKLLDDKWNAKKANHAHFENEAKPITINVGKIQGGDWASSVPAWCVADVRASIYPGEDPKKAATEIERHIYDACQHHEFLKDNLPKFEYNGFFAEGYVLEQGSEAEETLAISHKQSFGNQLDSYITPAYLDARIFNLYSNCKALVYGPITNGVHGFDERVNLASLKRVTGTIALFIAHWCGLEKSLNE